MIVDVVEDFGADLTGGSDSTAAFVAAIDAVTRRAGGIIDIPAGLFRIDGAPLRVRTAVHFRGAGDIVRSFAPGNPHFTGGSQTTLAA